MKTTLANRQSTASYSPLPIDQLFLGCLAQNPRTQRELFDRLYPKMLGICLRYMKNSAAAEDVLLVAFRKVFDRIGQFRQTGSFLGWIRRIVVNECLMALEKEAHWKNQTDLDKINSPANQAGPEDPLHWEDLLKTMQLLPMGYRRVFELFVLEGLSHEEIGKRLCISENTSKSQLSRARVQLQRLLQLGPRQN
ncbi:RNA polymerase sigma-70 factor, ECF subfamily [Algoriphagus alkaliphilus]|uniref:RNA polymerase sigma-70 factor, ECF subfamily n=1 Tax=Algoriphagus alkaliphilus TaxID=279824 RepID=A0A1G5ZBV3_9BACT|nr:MULTISPECIES: sigma-70 family RNA polymerase sigma factor [Algoriphagus]MDP2042916.1 sigma-70 family RNA polymerase sigma factor [Algoriphagus sp.]MDP3473413.1 sigma-70 family RNA polymerase sigma factor [Algoriphagus sp.]SDA91950.1 RNA polymerase sigma-70 factor, ECF subfamily [Algoriphagus alkaliphilus]